MTFDLSIPNGSPATNFLIGITTFMVSLICLTASFYNMYEGEPVTQTTIGVVILSTGGMLMGLSFYLRSDGDLLSSSVAGGLSTFLLILAGLILMTG